MGHKWAAEDTNPLEQFARRLHGMFLAVLGATKKREDEASLLFPVERRKAPQDCYPWHQLQLPSPRACPTHLPPIGTLSRDWKWGADFLPALLGWLSELMWLQPDDGLPQGHSRVFFMELALDFESYAGRPLPPTP